MAGGAAEGVGRRLERTGIGGDPIRCRAKRQRVGTTAIRCQPPERPWCSNHSHGCNRGYWKPFSPTWTGHSVTLGSHLRSRWRRLGMALRARSRTATRAWRHLHSEDGTGATGWDSQSARGWRTSTTDAPGPESAWSGLATRICIHAAGDRGDLRPDLQRRSAQFHASLFDDIRVDAAGSGAFRSALVSPIRSRDAQDKHNSYGARGATVRRARDGGRRP